MEATNYVECLCFELCLDSEKRPMGVQISCKPTSGPPPSLHHHLPLDENMILLNTSKFSVQADRGFRFQEKGGEQNHKCEKAA